MGGIPPCPYRGLFAFQKEDAHLFKGREQFIQDLAQAVKRKPLVAVVGPSGSGKSSVVFAGLIPTLRAGAQGITPSLIVSFRPGNNPIEALASAIAPVWQYLQDENARRLVELELANALRQDCKALYKIIEKLVRQNQGTRLVLIADQFEELYTQSPESELKPFLDALLTAYSCAPAFTLVVTLRADFYGHALSYRPFSDALQGAIHKHKGGLLTNQAYEEIGGVEKALANYAEAVYACLSEADRIRAQRVFIQLVQPGIGKDDNRRLATRDQIKQENWDLVTRLASSRLVVTNCNESTQQETVEIVHEALIRSWGRLEHWLQIDGEFRLWQEQLRAAMHQWESSGKDEGALLRGKPLADAEYWQLKRLDELSSGERYFIRLSLELRSGEFKKQKRRRQLTISGISGSLVGALVLAGVTLWQWQNR